VVLFNPSFGEIHFQVSGIGQLPGIMPITQMYAPLGEIGSHSILFRNPFPYPLPIDVILSEGSGAWTGTNSRNVTDGENDSASASPQAFSLLLRNATDLVLQAKAPVQISTSFSPTHLGRYDATIQVRSSINGRNLLWCFPVIGMAESGSTQVLPKLMTPCKTSLMRDVEVRLDGLRLADLCAGEEIDISQFTVDTIIDAKISSLISRSFRATPVEIVEIGDDANSNALSAYQKTNFLMKFRLLFEPLRTFNSSVELIIVCKNKGRWHVVVELEASEPEPDDVVKLCASVGSVDKVSFRLSNRFLGFSNFQAFFTARSSLHFTVTPSAGVLAPFGSEGTMFVVSFAPTEYGLREIANLIISTDDTQWNYEITGSYPDLVIDNSLIKSKTDSGLARRGE
jgi:hypothetical protein